MNSLWYNEEEQTISLDGKNWIRASNQSKANEDKLFFSLNGDSYLIYQWKEHVPFIFKEKADNTIYYGNFLTVYDVPYAYCEEWKEMKGKGLEEFKVRFKELRKIQGKDESKGE